LARPSKHLVRTERLYGEDGSFEKRITASDAQAMLASGEAEEVYEDRCGKPHYIGIRKRGVHEQNPDKSPTTLTMADMQANVGITDGEIGAPPRRGRVRAAVTKIGSWPYVGDTKAVRVGIRI
jgi:hypothetical protein